MKTQSVTLRLPTDILDAIEQKAGKGKRSEFIIQTLRESLGIERQSVNIDPMIAAQVGKLLHEFEVFKTQLDGITTRLEKIEKTPKPVMAESKTDKQAINSQSLEEIKLPLEIPNEIPEDAKVVDGKELLDLLRKIEPSSGWNVGKLRPKRQGSAATRFHDVGKLRFVYKGEAGGEGNQKRHEWWIVSDGTTSSS